MEDKKLSHEESIMLINQMIRKAKDNVHDSGFAPIMWGVVISICALTTYAQIKWGKWLPFDVWWLAFLALVPQLIVSAKQGKKMKVKSYDETALNYVWGVFTVGIFMIIFLNANVFKIAAGTGFKFRDFSSAYFLLWYGMPGMITGGMKNCRSLLIGGIICWVLSVVSVYTPVDIDMLLIALAAICAWLVPGLILRKQYKAEMKKLHV